MGKEEKIDNESAQEDPFVGEVRKMGEKLLAEGYHFELSVPNANEIVLKVGGRQFNFNKKQGIEERIVARIRELGK